VQNQAAKKKEEFLTWQNLYYMDTIEEVRIIKGLDK
jgi:hypothetical protein